MSDDYKIDDKGPLTVTIPYPSRVKTLVYQEKIYNLDAMVDVISAAEHLCNIKSYGELILYLENFKRTVEKLKRGDE